MTKRNIKSNQGVIHTLPTKTTINIIDSWSNWLELTHAGLVLIRVGLVLVRVDSCLTRVDLCRTRVNPC